MRSPRGPVRPRKGAIPESAQVALRAKLEQHVRTHWKDRCREVVVRFRGVFAYSDENYEPSFLPTGAFVGTPEEAFDCAAQVYLQD